MSTLEVLFERWCRLLKDARATCDPAETFESIREAYSEPHRRYHTLEHILDCLQEFDTVQRLAFDPIAVELAIWFHDIVYVVGQKDNEESSVWTAYNFCQTSGLGYLIGVVWDLILATKPLESREGHTPDQLLISDIDLSGIGAPRNVFKQQNALLWEEFGTKFSEEEIRRRETFLFRAFLSRRPFYAVEEMRNRYERRARNNIFYYLRELGAATS